MRPFLSEKEALLNKLNCYVDSLNCHLNDNLSEKAIENIEAAICYMDCAKQNILEENQNGKD